jgi:hypothetical protein
MICMHSTDCAPDTVSSRLETSCVQSPKNLSVLDLLRVHVGVVHASRCAFNEAKLSVAVSR